MNAEEIKRLDEVKRFLTIDFDGVSEFKEITDLASELCGAPISLITLLDKETNWVKVATGVDIKESPRAISFCQHAIAGDGILVIPDATKDTRFDGNPLVHQAPEVRFYAGAPLVMSNGYKLGTLCLYDLQPNDLTEQQHKILTSLSKQVVYLMEMEFNKIELSQKLEELEQKNDSLRQIAQLQSHAIRQPLTSVIGLVNLVRDGQHDVDDNWLDMITKATDILDGKIHSIVNETMGNRDMKLTNFNKVVEEIEDYAIILLDKTGHIENWNRGAQSLKGYNADEIVGRSFTTFYTDEDMKNKLPQSLLEQARKDGTARNIGWRKRKDGSLFWASVVITAIHDYDGTVIGFTKVTRDLTDMKKTQDSLSLVEARFRKMIDELEDFTVILMDLDGNIERWNTGAELILQYEPDEVVGKHFSILYAQEDVDAGLPDSLLKKAAKKGKVQHEGKCMRKDGTALEGGYVITAIHDDDGVVIGYVKVSEHRADAQGNEQAA